MLINGITETAICTAEFWNNVLVIACTAQAAFGYVRLLHPFDKLLTIPNLFGTVNPVAQGFSRWWTWVIVNLHPANIYIGDTFQRKSNTLSVHLGMRGHCNGKKANKKYFFHLQIG